VNPSSAKSDLISDKSAFYGQNFNLKYLIYNLIERNEMIASLIDPESFKKALDFLYLFLGVIVAASAAFAVFQKIWGFFHRGDTKQDFEISKLKKENASIKKDISLMEVEIRELKSSQKSGSEKFYNLLEADSSRMEKLENSERITQLALLALLGHARTGNNQQELEEAQKALNNLLTGNTVTTAPDIN
jgi:hypothetical protein